MYDGLGRRVRKTIGSAVTEFVYDWVNPIQELSNASVTSMLPGLRVDEYFTRTDISGTRTFLTDALGSSLALVDSAGSLSTTYTYEPFGKATATNVGENSFQFTGRENDGTGLYYYRARYYHPGLMRFISEDLVSEVGTNRYGYVRNTPLNALDPYGLRTLLIHGGFGSSGPNGSSDQGGNTGLNALQDALEKSGESVVRLNSGELARAVKEAEQACAAGEPLSIVGHSLGGTTAIDTAFLLYRLGWVPSHLITIDPVSPNHTVIQPQIPTTNFVQRNGWPQGEYLRGGRVNPPTDQLVEVSSANPHSAITGDPVGPRIQSLILGGRKPCQRR